MPKKYSLISNEDGLIMKPMMNPQQLVMLWMKNLFKN